MSFLVVREGIFRIAHCGSVLTEFRKNFRFHLSCILIGSVKVEVHFSVTCSLYVVYRPEREIPLWLWSKFCLVDVIFFSKKRKNKRKIEKPVHCSWILLHSVLEKKDTPTEDGAFFLANSSPQQKSTTPLQPSGSPAEISERPAPHVVSEEELNLVRTCLQRWRNEIEQDVQGWPQMYLL